MKNILQTLRRMTKKHDSNINLNKFKNVNLSKFVNIKNYINNNIDYQ